MIGLGFVYLVAGATFLAFALLSLKGRRFGNAAFYGLLALSFWAGDRLGDLGNGVLVLGLVALAGFGLVGRKARAHGPQAATQSRVSERGNGLFLPALVIPVTALAGTLLFKQLPDLVDSKQVTLVSLTLGVLIALTICYAWLRTTPAMPFAQGVRLMDGVGWAAILPQMLASLGAIFALAGVGEAVGTITGQLIPHGSLIGAVLVYALGMAGFTMIMGNAFAAFPVMFAAVGMPVLVAQQGGNPVAIAAIGMLAGFCGTLMTPMAANFNLVPAALLELRDRHGVIKAQVPTAIPLLGANILIIYFMAFR